MVVVAMLAAMLAAAAAGNGGTWSILAGSSTHPLRLQSADVPKPVAGTQQLQEQQAAFSVL